ncbi:MAG: SWIM zinc finger family protein [Akkermansia sp.]|nr:SWIM zinc finger family protein [Akkermansia sp.]
MCDDFTPRLRVKDLEKLAAERLVSLRAEGEELHPVVNTTRRLAANFWGSAWMRHLARCEAGGLCLAPGRALLRHGCVLDLRIAPGLITAKVSAEEVFEVSLRISPPDEELLENLRKACCGRIDSLVALMEGKVDAAVLEHLCAEEGGLLPEPADWHMSCSCPEWGEPCTHAAAAIYAAGCLIDADPMLLFTLRCVPPELFLEKPAPGVVTDYDAAALGKAFGIELDLE